MKNLGFCSGGGEREYITDNKNQLEGNRNRNRVCAKLRRPRSTRAGTNEYFRSRIFGYEIFHGIYLRKTRERIQSRFATDFPRGERTIS
nr:MAG TPA: hypothetical protein [Siphoviridae sp. ctELO16]